MGYFLVFLGAGLGGTLRHAVNEMSLRWFGAGIPLGTIAVNVIGSLLMGILTGYLAQRGADEPVRLFFATGLLGGFTTFSAFSLDAAVLLERGSYGALALYLAGTVIVALVAFFAGYGLRYGN